MQDIQAIKIFVQRSGRAREFSLPARATSGAAGFDLRASEPCIIPVGGRALVPTGLRLAIPDGYEAQVRPRSGLALKHGIILPNAPGTIDSDYRGELGVIMMNLGDKPFEIQVGDRIAQIIFARVIPVEWQEVETLDETARGEGGFGSTGQRDTCENLN